MKFAFNTRAQEIKRKARQRDSAKAKIMAQLEKISAEPMALDTFGVVWSTVRKYVTEFGKKNGVDIQARLGNGEVRVMIRQGLSIKLTARENVDLLRPVYLVETIRGMLAKMPLNKEHFINVDAKRLNYARIVITEYRVEHGTSYKTKYDPVKGVLTVWRLK